MPTKRALAILVLAIALYLLANQTQVGWVYIMTNILLGLLLVAFIYSRGMLKPIQIRRTFQNLSAQPTSQMAWGDNARLNDIAIWGDEASSANEGGLDTPEFFEDDSIEVSLHLTHAGWKPAFLINGQEQCLFAPPDEQQQSFFAPSIFKRQPLELIYQTDGYRRGFYQFSTLRLQSAGPFSLFRTQQIVPVPSEILIYPRYHPLKRIRLLENRGFTDRRAMRVGASNEIIGTREYRSGDPLRQIHWRSTARVGKLVAKEVADNDQLTLTVAMDLSVDGSVGQGKFSTFETGLRIAASLGYYATREQIPIYLVGQSRRWQAPAMALSWWGLLNYLAKVENDGQTSLAQLLQGLPALPFVVVLISRPDKGINRALTRLQQNGSRVLTIFITPDGTMPAWATPPTGPELEFRLASPYNWVEILDAL